MSSFLLTALLFVTVFGFLVIVHELGHYCFARLFKVGVEEFSVGFGNKLFGVKDANNTTWCVRSIPFGGYVRLLDEDKPEIKGGKLQDKKCYQKLFIMLGGPAANIITAFLLSWCTIFFMGYTVPQSTKIYEIERKGETLPPSDMELQPNDIILKVDGQNVNSWKEVQLAINGKKSAMFAVKRGDMHTLLIKGEPTNVSTSVEPSMVGKILKQVKSTIKKWMGFKEPLEDDATKKTWALHPFPPQKEFFSFVESAVKAADFVWSSFLEFLDLLRLIAVRGIGMLSGPVGIGRGLSSAASQGIEPLLWLAIKLSLG